MWFGRFERYRLMGPDRSILGVYNLWRGDKGRKKASGVPDSWRNTAKEWGWKERAEFWDASLRAEVVQEAEQERLDVLTSGFALKHNRVAALEQLAHTLIAAITGAPFGEDKTMIILDASADLDPRLIAQLRGIFEDIAAELGQRSSTVDLNATFEQVDPSELTDEQLAAIVAGKS